MSRDWHAVLPGRKRASSLARTVLIAMVVAAGLIGTTVLVFLTGGTRTAAPQLMNVFIVFAGMALGARAAFGTAAAAGLLMGPFMPVDVASAAPQATGAWLVRLAVFLLVGLAAGLLSDRAHRSAQDMMRILDGLPLPVVVTDGMRAAATVSYLNDAGRQLLGDLTGQSLEAILADAHARRLDGTPLEAALSGPSSTTAGEQRLELSIRARDGRTHVVHLHLHEAEGNTIAVLSDETARRHLERTRRDLITLAGHHLRTPLTPLVGFSHLVLRHAQMQDDPVLKGYSEALVRNGDRLERLVDRIQQLSTVAPASARDFTVVDIETLVHGTWSGSPDDIVLAVPATLQAYVSPRHLQRALQELFDNTHRHGRPPVEVAAGTSNGSTVLWVRDAGPGVPGEVAERVFEPYVGRVQDPNAAPEGAGLGLPLARAWLQATGGTLTWDDGQRAFRVQLPRSDFVLTSGRGGDSGWQGLALPPPQPRPADGNRPSS